jgi:hypothetical protein
MGNLMTNTPATAQRVDTVLAIVFANALILAGGGGAIHYAMLGGLGLLAALAPLAVLVLGIYLMFLVSRKAV